MYEEYETPRHPHKPTRAHCLGGSFGMNWELLLHSTADAPEDLYNALIPTSISNVVIQLFRNRYYRVSLNSQVFKTLTNLTDRNKYESQRLGKFGNTILHHFQVCSHIPTWILTSIEILTELANLRWRKWPWKLFVYWRIIHRDTSCLSKVSKT